jgi:hypothetical protein
MSAANWAAASTLGLDHETTQLVATGLELIHVLQVYTSSMMTLAVWDWLVCLPTEWERIWKREWSLVKFLYLWTRYYGLLSFAINLWLFNGEFSIDRCKTLHYLILPTCMFTTLGSEAILAIRTYAFLGKKKLHGIILSAMLLAETGFFLFLAIHSVYQTPLALGTIGPCTATDIPGKHLVNGFWLAPVVFDLLCTVATLVKFFSLGHGAGSQVVRMFVREGFLYFLAVAGVNVLNAVFMFQPNPNIQNINCFLALILSQVLCCRLVLNLRKKDGNLTPYASGADSGFGRAQNTFGGTPIGHTQQQSSISFPLGPVKNNQFGEQDMYGGVKVQVDVERNSGGGKS